MQCRNPRGPSRPSRRFKYPGCMVNGGGTDVIECENKVMSGRGVAGAIVALMNAKGGNLDWEISPIFRP